MINCIYFRIRSKKGIKYQYCTKQCCEIPKNGCYGCVDKQLKTNNSFSQKQFKSPNYRSRNKFSKTTKINPFNKVCRYKNKVSDSTYKTVLARDNYRCRLCGNDNIYELNLHHIYYRSQRRDLIDEPDNCIMLCGNFSKNKCHMKVHSNKKKYQPLLLEMVKNSKM